MHEDRDNLILAAAEAWRLWKRGEIDQFERIMLIAQALLAARVQCMTEAGIDRPLGYTYNHLFQDWQRKHGFADFPRNWAGDCIWLAENEPEVRLYWTKACELRSNGLPSAYPRTLRLQVVKARSVPMRKRVAPNERCDFLIRTIGRRILTLEEPTRSAFAIDLADTIEAALIEATHRDCAATGDRASAV